MSYLKYFYVVFTTVCVLSSHCIMADDQNLIANPSFEVVAQKSGEFLAPPWTNQGECVSIATDHAHSGKRAAKIEIKDLGTTTRWQNFKMPNIPISQQPYYFSAWVRTENVVQSPKATYHMARGTLFFQDANGQNIKDRHRDLFALQGTQEWTLCEKVFIPPPTARTATLALSLDLCTGTVWFDDITLRPLAASGDSAKKNEEEELKRLQLLQVGHVKLAPRPLGWTMQGEGPSWSSGEGHTGTHCLRISQTAFNEHSVWQLWRCDPVEFSGGPVRLVVWAKGANIKRVAPHKRSASVHIVWLDEKDRELGNAAISLPEGTFPWQRFEQQCTPPPDTRAFKLTVSLSYLTGDLWVDDLEVLDFEGRNILPNNSLEQPELRPQVVQEDVNLPEQYEIVKDTFPESATNIRISNDGNFTRNTRPVFLVATQEAYQTFPWTARLLGMDVIALNGIGPPNPTLIMKRRWGKLLLSFREDDYLETELRDVLSHGFAAYAAITEAGRDGDPLFRERPDLFVEGGHYFSYHDADPDGKRLRRNARLSLLQTTRRFPIFLYELFNEVHYMSYHPSELARFRSEMKEKYGDIARANAAWGTAYKNFDEIYPPTKRECDTRMTWREGWSVNLFVDWVKYTERRFGEICLEQRQIVKSADRNPNINITVQSYILGDYSSCGAYPVEKVKSEDVYGHEEYMLIFKQLEGAENEQEILRTLSFCLRADAVAAADRSKPVFNEEAGVCPGVKELTPDRILVDLHGEWRFVEDNKEEGVVKGYYKTSYDDSAWGAIKVPGLWGEQGYPTCTVGWYRKRFMVPEYRGQVYLDGSQLSDVAEIYLNGELVHKTKKWNESFCIEVGEKLQCGHENCLAIHIVNKYFMNKIYWGGIRERIRLTKIPSKPDPITPGQMRMYLWSSMYHNICATLFFNTFCPEGYDRSDTNPDHISPAALRAVPAVRQEINALGHILLPKPRRRAQVALLYTFESQRGRIPNDYKEWLAGPMVSALGVYYGGLFFSQIPVDVLLTKDVLGGIDPRYKVMIVAAAPRVHPGIVKPLHDFVQAGGTLIVGPGSMTVDDEFHGPLDCSGLLGPAGTKVYTLGKGKVCRISEEMGLRQARGVLASLVQAAGVRPELIVKGNAPFVEAHAFIGGNEQVWYLNNWGAGSPSVHVAPVYRFVEGATYKVLASESPNVPLAPLDGDGRMSGAHINQGLRFTLPSCKPIVVWIGRAKAAPPQTCLSPAHTKVLERTWSYAKHPVRVLIDAAKWQHVTRDKVPSAVALMEAQGVQVDGNAGEIGDSLTIITDRRESGNLSDYAAVIMLAPARPGYKTAEVDRLVRFVEEGGGLLVCGSFYRGPHNWYSNVGLNSLTSRFGVLLENDSICDPTHNAMNTPRFPLFTQFAQHEITRGVRSLQSKGMAALRIEDAKLKPLIVSDADSYRIVGRWEREEKTGLPAAVALERGKGRVVIMGDGQWLLPDYLCQADNARLMVNMITWLTSGRARHLDDIAIRAVLQQYEF